MTLTSASMAVVALLGCTLLLPAPAHGAGGAALARGTRSTLGFGSNAAGSAQTLSLPSDVCTGRDPCFVLVDVPAGCEASPSKPSACPVVFKLHGSGGGVRENAKSDFTTRGSIGVYPQGSNLPDTPGWNLGARTNLNCASHDDFDCTKDPNEGQFFADIITALRTHGVAGNLYAYGSSNGSGMAHRLGINGGSALPFKGIVATASQMLDKPARSGPGTYNYNQPQQGEAAVCILGINGDADGLIPIEGGPLFTNKEHFAFKSADASSRAWADHNGCKASSPATTAETHSSSTVTHAVYDCPAAAHVEHYTVHGAGHTGADKNLWPAILDFIAACEAGQTGATPTMGNPASSPSSLASTTESMASQATDAPETALPFVCASGQTSRCCGDGVCDGPETAAMCPADCGRDSASSEATTQGTTASSSSSSQCAGQLVEAEATIEGLKAELKAMEAKLAMATMCGNRGRRATNL